MRYSCPAISFSYFKRFLLTLLVGGGLGMLSHSAQAQNQLPQDAESPFRLLPNYEKVYTYVERMPVFKNGGNEGLMAFIKKNRPTLPAGAKGLFMDFVVDKSGKPTQAKLITVPSGITIPTSTYQEVGRLLKEMEFVPGQQGGRAASVSFTVPLARSK
ncbi:hypothetical protein [Hymenobacter crusticola]|uniref:TonB C-terminal domain-containing protein n=1 Tax=Hymenobacter crusticola TaxID=1770526 RepID=A0A243WJA3_9BACT|nr:hypothetical protein [Hymenobacter crusticola]OUJ75984.1 hypothetical protein BXP70_01495 [Hymenobacter crusticola]